MKKHLFIVSILIITLIFVSCDTSYMYKPTKSDNIEEIKEKTTIRTFDHLKEPIVIALPVYEKYYLFGNKNNNYRQKRAGDIIAVIDIESDTVYDWVFFPGDHGWSIWRLVEAGSNPTRYLMSSVGTGTVATLDPQKTTLKIAETRIRDNFWNYKAYGTKVPLCYETRDIENSVWDYHIRLFDSVTNTLSEKDLCVQTSEVGFINYMRSDSDGNFWFSYPQKNGKVKIQELDSSLEIKKDELVSFDSCFDQNIFHVCYASTKYIFVSYSVTGETRLSGLFIVDRENGVKQKIEDLEIDEKLQYIYDVQDVSGEFYAIAPNQVDPELPVGCHIYQLELDDLSVKESFFLPFDMTENTYVRGNRIYFMCSRNRSDITYTYYDTVTRKQGDVVRISAESIISDYLGE